MTPIIGHNDGKSGSGSQTAFPAGPTSKDPSLLKKKGSTTFLKEYAPKGVRDRLIFRLASVYRLEIHALQRLNLNDFNTESGLLQVTKRGGKTRNIVLDPETRTQMIAWIGIRKPYAMDPQALFVGLHWTWGRKLPGLRLSRRGLYQILTTGVRATGRGPLEGFVAAR